MGEVHCLKPDCERRWPRDPVLEVACPVCKAPIGVGCSNPSEHRKWGDHAFHAARDIAADQAGAYGVCPTARCGLAKKSRQMELL